MKRSDLGSRGATASSRAWSREAASPPAEWQDRGPCPR